MPPALRFLRLYILLLVGGDDLLSAYLATGRFKMRKKRMIERKAALARLIEANLAAGGAYGLTGPMPTSDAERAALQAVQRELPPPLSGVALALERLRLAVFE